MYCESTPKRSANWPRSSKIVEKSRRAIQAGWSAQERERREHLAQRRQRLLFGLLFSNPSRSARVS